MTPRPAAPPESARQHYLLASLLAKRAVKEANKAKPRGPVAVTQALVRHQITGAAIAERAVADMLLEQRIDAPPAGRIVPTSFTTDARAFAGMLDATDEFDRLVESLVQDATRAAESVASAVRPDVWHIRYVSPPCCGRCAVLAGRIYRFSESFLRHPNCDCVMIPTTVAAEFAQSPDTLFENGQIRGLSKADTQAIGHGADVAQVVNVRRRAAGLTEAGEVLKRGSRLTPSGIYRLAGNDREKAIELLARSGYIN